MWGGRALLFSSSVETCFLESAVPTFGIGGVMLLIAAFAVHAAGGFQVAWNRPTAVAAGLWAIGWPLLFLSIRHAMAMRAGRKEQWSLAHRLVIMGWIACIGWLALESVLAIHLYNTVTSAGW